MLRSPALRLLTGLVTVLAVAAVAYVVRGAVGSQAADTPKLPGRATTTTTAAAPATFSVRSAGRNVFPKGSATIATARQRSVRVYPSPKPARSKAARRKLRVVRQRVFNKQRIPLTFLVVSRRKGWLRVELPTRPNRARGWIRRADADLTFTTLRVEIRRKAHRLRLYDGKRVVMSKPIAVGQALSPTPAGRYFVTDIVRTGKPRGFYGPYALGLSAHSTVYTSFEGGDGQVGIHGTNQPSAIGSDVSHGCIRVRNTVIAQLARRLPLGTPVTITA